MPRFLTSIRHAFHLKGGLVIGFATAAPKLYSSLAAYILSEYYVTWPVLPTGWLTIVAFLATAGIILLIRVAKLDSKRLPKLVIADPFISFAKVGPAIRPEDESEYQRVNYIHVVVKNCSDIQVNNCQINILSIQKKTHGKITKAPPCKPFPIVTAGGFDGHQKIATIYPDLPQHFDIAYAQSTDNKFDLAPKIPTPHIIPPQFFGEDGDYDFRIIVTADNTPSAPGTVRISWNGDWSTIKARMLRNG